MSLNVFVFWRVLRSSYVRSFSGSFYASVLFVLCSEFSAVLEPKSLILDIESLDELCMSSHERSHSGQGRPRVPHEQPRAPQECPKSAPRAPKSVQECPRAAQEPPRAAQERPKSDPSAAKSSKNRYVCVGFNKF